MLPLVPFAIGLLTGAAAIQVWRIDKTRQGLGKAREKIREATVSGLNKLESSSAAMRGRLASDTEPDTEVVAAAVAEVPPATAPAARKKPAAKRAPARKKAAAPAAAPDEGAAS